MSVETADKQGELSSEVVSRDEEVFQDRSGIVTAVQKQQCSSAISCPWLRSMDVAVQLLNHPGLSCATVRLQAESCEADITGQHAVLDALIQVSVTCRGHGMDLAETGTGDALKRDYTPKIGWNRSIGCTSRFLLLNAIMLHPWTLLCCCCGYCERKLATAAANMSESWSLPGTPTFAKCLPAGRCLDQLKIRARLGA